MYSHEYKKVKLRMSPSMCLILDILSGFERKSILSVDTQLTI